MQCGITCLQMICKHFGKEFSIETLSRYCFATTEGVSLLASAKRQTSWACIAFVAEFRWSRCGKLRFPASSIGNEMPFFIRYGISIIAVVLAVVALGVWVFYKSEISQR